MTPEYHIRFQALLKKKGRRKLKRFRADFILLSDDAKELFLQLQGGMLFSEHDCTPKDVSILIDLGYTTNRQVNDARISSLKIIEYGLRQEYVTVLKSFLYPHYSPDDEMLEAFKSGSVQEVLAVADKNSYKSYYRHGRIKLPI